MNNVRLFYDNYTKILHINKSMITISKRFSLGYRRVDGSKSPYFELGYLRIRI